MGAEEPETVELLRRVGAGDDRALERLMSRHRGKLRRMITFRMNRRLAGRIDPSDVVQEVLMTASRSINEFLRGSPLPFYPWLRRIAFNRLIDLHRTHLLAQKRSVHREDPWIAISDESAVHLASKLASVGSSPSGGVVRREIRDRVRSALDKLTPRDREILVLRHLEELPLQEIAAIMGLSEDAARKRQVRALERLHKLLSDDS